MKIALAQVNYHIGNFESNFSKIKKAIQEAKIQQADLVIFSELAVCGYPPLDFLEFDGFIDQCEQVIAKITKESKDIGIIIGSPSRNQNKEGKDLYNSAYFITDGVVKTVIHKTLLPSHDVFNEFRYFESNKQIKLLEFKGKKIALTICEDLWNLGDDPLYTICPMDHLQKLSPDFMINIAASPFDYNHAQNRIEILKANTKKYELPIFYANQTGANTELIFDGGSLVMTKDGYVYDELPYFTETVKIYSLDDILNSKIETDNDQPKKEEVIIHNGLVSGIRDYFHKSAISDAVIGLSGGIDSAVTASLAVEALGNENVKVLLMPSRFSSPESVEDAQELANNLGISDQVIPISEIYDTYLNSLEKFFENTSFDITEQNIQSRIRSNVLMAFANKFNYVLLNTSNKSELAVGYGTLYGDLAGGISVLGDVYKSQVFQLAEYINRDKTIIPQNTITKPPSAELSFGQKDSDDLPEYEALDKILFEYIENTKTSKQLIEMGYDSEVVEKALMLVNNSEFKRFQTSPILRVSPKAFGMGRRIPIVAKFPS